MQERTRGTHTAGAVRVKQTRRLCLLCRCQRRPGPSFGCWSNRCSRRLLATLSALSLAFGLLVLLALAWPFCAARRACNGCCLSGCSKDFGRCSLRRLGGRLGLHGRTTSQGRINARGVGVLLALLDHFSQLAPQKREESELGILLGRLHPVNHLLKPFAVTQALKDELTKGDVIRPVLVRNRAQAKLDSGSERLELRYAVARQLNAENLHRCEQAPALAIHVEAPRDHVEHVSASRRYAVGGALFDVRLQLERQVARRVQRLCCHHFCSNELIQSRTETGIAPQRFGCCPPGVERLGDPRTQVVVRATIVAGQLSGEAVLEPTVCSGIRGQQPESEVRQVFVLDYGLLLPLAPHGAGD